MAVANRRHVSRSAGEVSGVLAKHTRSALDCMKQLKLTHRPTFRVNYLSPALEAGLIERTVPNKPNSRLQKYRLTEKGLRHPQSVTLTPPKCHPCSDLNLSPMF